MRHAKLLALAAALPCGAALAADRTENVRFRPGATATTISSSIRGDAGVVYRLAAVEGQTLHVLFAPRNRSCYVNAYAPGRDIGKDEAAFIGATSGNEFGVNSTAAGDYKLQVYLMRNAARRNEVCRFRLSIELTGAPGGASAGVSDQVMADACKGAAAAMYGVEPRNVRLTGRLIAATDGYTRDGSIDKRAGGVKMLRCVYKANRTLDRVQAMTRDGE